MTEAELKKLLDEAITISQEIKEIEAGRLSSLNSMLNVYKIKLTEGLKELNQKTVEAVKGKVSLVQSKGKSTIDTEAIMHALGVSNLDEFKKIGNPYEYILLSEFKN